MKICWKRKIEADYSYASTQVNLPEDVSKKIIRWGKENIDDDDIKEDEEDDSMGREDTPHCTILYGIVDNNVEPVKNLLKYEKPIEAELGKISVFTGDEYDVVKIDVKSKDLHRLHKKLADNIENENKFPEYKPHVTIAYVSPGKGKKYSGSLEFEGIKLTFNKIRFSSKSEEVSYIYLTKNIASNLNWKV